MAPFNGIPFNMPQANMGAMAGFSAGRQVAGGAQSLIPQNYNGFGVPQAQSYIPNIPASPFAMTPNIGGQIAMQPKNNFAGMSANSNSQSTVGILNNANIPIEAKIATINDRYGAIMMKGAASNPKVQALFQDAQAAYVKQEQEKYQEKMQELEALQAQYAEMQQQGQKPKDPEALGGNLFGGLLSTVQKNPQMLKGLLGLLKPADDGDAAAASDDDESTN